MSIAHAPASPLPEHDIEPENNRALLLVEQTGSSAVHPKKIKAPVDEVTGLPLPLLPPAEIPSSRRSREANWHHHYHPSISPYLTSKAGLAVRHVRVQLVPIEQHDLYHHIFEGPKKLPRTSTDRFGHIVLMCAGYMPKYAIDV